jgi:hypothetical protein
MSKPRVIAFEPVALDVRKAGAVEYLFDRSSSRTSLWDEEIKRQIVVALEAIDYRPGYDCFLVVGSMAAMTICISTIVSYFGPVRVLMYDATHRAYVSRVLGDTAYESDSEAAISDGAASA